MLKIFILAALFIMGILLIITIYCAIVVADRSNERANIIYKQGQICLRCKTGQYSYELDKNSEYCPYIVCYNNGKCPFFQPVDAPAQKNTDSPNSK